MIHDPIPHPVSVGCHSHVTLTIDHFCPVILKLIYELFNLVENKVKAIVCLGKDNQRVIQAFRGKVESIVESGSMEDAVKAAYYLARDGESVLLSPACASFDLFESFEDRGRQFKEAVRSL